MGENIKKYLRYIKGLDKHDPYSIKKAVEYYKGTFTKYGEDPDRETAFLRLESFHLDVIKAAGSCEPIRSYVEHLNNDRIDSSSIKFFEDENGKKTGSKTVGSPYVKEVPMPETIRGVFARNGMRIYQNEGRYYVYREPSYLLYYLKDYLSCPTVGFLQQEADEDEELFLNDMALQISWDKLGERIIFWETFLKKYPGFVCRGKAEQKFLLYLGVFFLGVPNTLPFGFCLENETGELNAELRLAYERYIEKFYPESPSAVSVNKYYGILRDNGFFNNDTVKSYLEETVTYDHKRKIRSIMRRYKEKDKIKIRPGKTVRCIFLISCAFVVLGICIVLPNAKPIGRMQARYDIMRGQYKIKGYGLGPFSSYEDNADIFASHGIERVAVAGCVVNDFTIENVAAYNEVMKKEIRDKFGVDIYE